MAIKLYHNNEGSSKVICIPTFEFILIFFFEFFSLNMHMNEKHHLFMFSYWGALQNTSLLLQRVKRPT